MVFPSPKINDPRQFWQSKFAETDLLARGKHACPRTALALHANLRVFAGIHWKLTQFPIACLFAGAFPTREFLALELQFFSHPECVFA
ncbi:hypothetical protein RSSM_00005 [Rhodopirellula sallentina SM41]|uniref:Uncharacterized protein n=1 Tax=Rhodopirellula sallentina SM41 TaxID=1263870 RepID=M5UAU5_9BACT|nr:hypothetical protein RSSM_00005 [Rhodopirellula sallentina SM41]